MWAPAEVRRITARLADATDTGVALEVEAESRLREAVSEAAWAHAVVRLLRAGTGVARVAAAMELSERQLHRRCLHAFGYGPKTVARVLRLQRALDLARSGVPYAETAARSGYADQAHLARDVKDLAGIPLGELTR